MQKQLVLFSVVSLAISAAEAKSTEYECDDGARASGYRIKVVDLGRDVQEVVVLKKANGSANVVENRKLKRVSATNGATQYESGKAGRRVALKKSTVDADGNWTGTFTLPEKGGARVVRTSCAEVETLTL